MSEPATIGFRAPDGAGRPRRAQGPLRARAARSGRRHRGARRRRLHARDPARLHRAPGADLRHEPGHGRVPAQHLPAGRPAGAAGERAAGAALRMRAQCRNGQVEHGLGINEVSLFRQTRQAASLRIEIDGVALERWCATASWSPPPPAAPPTTSRRTGRSCRSAPTCWRSPRSARSARGAGAAAEPQPVPDQRRRCRQTPGQRGRRLPKSATWSRCGSGRTEPSRSPCCSTPSTISRNGS